MTLVHTFAVLIAAATTAGSACADTFTVLNMNDSGSGSLRHALFLADNTPGHDVIEFHRAMSGTIELTSPLDIQEAVTIVGNPSRVIAIDGGGDVTAAFGVHNGVAEFGLIDMEVRNCVAAVTLGNQATRLNIHRCVFRDNGLQNVPTTAVFNAGYAGRSLVGRVQSCSFVNNRGAHAGVVINSPSPDGTPLDFINCTFVNNRSTHGAGVAMITADSIAGQGVTSFISCTLTNNRSSEEQQTPFSTVQVNGTEPALRIRNCVMSENTGGTPETNPDVGGGTAANTVFEGMLVDEDPGLAPLTRVNNLYVRIPLPGSPCIDTAYPDPDVRTDQVGTVRPVVVLGTNLPDWSDGSDVGAVEYIPQPCGADFNGDGSVNSQDFFNFLTAFFAGC